jgi:hypothetical protein
MIIGPRHTTGGLRMMIDADRDRCQLSQRLTYQTKSLPAAGGIQDDDDLGLSQNWGMALRLIGLDQSVRIKKSIRRQQRIGVEDGHRFA